MPLIPFERLDIASPLAPDEAAAAISASLEAPKRRWPFDRTDRVLEGSFEHGELQACRISYGRNSFRPLVVARLEPGPGGGSRLHGVMRLHSTVAAFAVAWCLFVMAMGLPFAVSTLSTPGNRALGLVPFGLLAFMWAMAAGGFTAEAKPTRAALQRILQASPETASAAR